MHFFAPDKNYWGGHGIRGPGFTPISAEIIVRRLDGRMAFGPGGTLEFGHFLVRVPSARRANRKEPRASALGMTRTRKSP
jgi:hypothetical protein